MITMLAANDFGDNLGDGVAGNDKPFLSSFPFVATPHAGNVN